MMKRQFNRMRQQLSHPNATSRAQEATEFLTEDLLQIEQRIEPAKRAAHSVSKRLQACLQGHCGAEMDKRVWYASGRLSCHTSAHHLFSQTYGSVQKKLPLMALSATMAESFKELDTESSLGKALEMGCCIQSLLAKILAEFEIAVERDILQPLNKLSEEELPIILKRKKTLQKLISDWNAIKSRLNQAAKSSSNSAGAGTGPGVSSAANKLEILKEEEEEVKRKVEQCKDEYMADLYHFSTKEDSYASYFIRLLEIQAQYHRQSLESLDSALTELKESHSQKEPSFTTETSVLGYYGVPLQTHLKNLGREIALPIEACVMMLLASGMKEEGLFRLAAGASVLRKLKSSLASGSNALEEFYSDPHAVAGALKSYLRELPEPLMTFKLYDEWIKVASLKDVDNQVQSLRDTCSHLPQDSYNNLRYLIKFLAKLAEHQHVNKMTPSNIAIVLGPNLLWPEQSTGDPMQLDLASVSSIQVVGVVEALIQNADILFPGEIDFNVSGMFTLPADVRLNEAAPVDTLPPKSPPACSPSPLDEETTNDSEVSSQPPSPVVTKPSSEATVPPAPTPANDTARKAKRPAPSRPTGPPPLAQARSMTPEHTASPKARPRRLGAPSIPPPLPPQPAPRHSRESLTSPGLPTISTPNCTADEGTAEGQSPLAGSTTVEND
ncbi:SH3 domain-binding protein 1 isoform X1 [Tympanuchus pallidicinctus]|uniref:SH3 domain-binding protein 1 isoform X1 n=1 Tax=Tympanuchus pallidicinctus TaxID=109042 RepID=UPI002287094B|nr:SH3 domain-binding protein 1 isoform X1 [Tympanuchus pallidicinctus]